MKVNNGNREFLFTGNTLSLTEEHLAEVLETRKSRPAFSCWCADMWCMKFTSLAGIRRCEETTGRTGTLCAYQEPNTRVAHDWDYRDNR